MLLLSKMSFEESRQIWETRANCISLTRWKRRKSSSVVVEIVVCLIATNFNHSANPIAREFHPVWQMRKITLFFSFFLEFHQLLRTSRFQTSFHISRFQQSSNQNEERKQNKFKTYFANAVEISMISTNLIKITLSQITIQKEWRLISFCENC